MNTMNIAQLEFSLTNAQPRSGRGAQQRRLSRAQWWFQRMRQVVDRACDWQPAPMPRPEQIWFSNAHRLIESKPRGAGERQMCE